MIGNNFITLLKLQEKLDKSSFFEISLNFDIAEETQKCCLKQLLILPFLCHKSATTCKTD